MMNAMLRMLRGVLTQTSARKSEAGLEGFARYPANGGWVDLSQDYWWNYHQVRKNSQYNIGDTNATARVGSYLPNAYGLYDMLGNAGVRLR